MPDYQCITEVAVASSRSVAERDEPEILFEGELLGENTGRAQLLSRLSI